MRAITCILGMLSAGAVSAPAGLFDKPDLNVITVTDVSSATSLGAPTATNPVYYAAACVGFRDFAAAMGGEKIPNQEEMVRVVSRILAKQGFLPADDHHPPTELLVYARGTMYPLRFLFPVGNQLLNIHIGNALGFVGGDRLGLIPARGRNAVSEIEGLIFRAPGVVDLIDMANDDLYVVKIAGYEYQAATQGKPRLLWQTRIACPCRGYWLQEALPVMLAVAGPNIARYTERPVWARASDRFKPNITIGDLKLEEYIDTGVLPVIDASKFPEKVASHSPADRRH